MVIRNAAGRMMCDKCGKYFESLRLVVMGKLDPEEIWEFWFCEKHAMDLQTSISMYNSVNTFVGGTWIRINDAVIGAAKWWNDEWEYAQGPQVSSVAPSAGSWLGVGRETIVGTPVSPYTVIPISLH